MRLWAPQAQGHDLSILIYSPLQWVWDVSCIPLSLTEYKALTAPNLTSFPATAALAISAEL